MTSRGTFDKSIFGFGTNDKDEFGESLRVPIKVTVVVIIITRMVFSFF